MLINGYTYVMFCTADFILQLRFVHRDAGSFSDTKFVRVMNTPLYSFFITKLGYAGVYLCRYSLEPPRRGGYNVFPQSMF